MAHTLLLLLPQSPFEPAAGDARSMRTICEMLVTQGFDVRALAVTSSYRSLPLRLAAARGSADTKQAAPSLQQFTYRGIHHTLLDVGDASPGSWQKAHGERFEALFQEELTRGFDVLFTYGGTPADVARRKFVRASGRKIVFGLRGFGYLQPGALEHIDAFIPCSQFVARRYEERLGLQMPVLPLPIWAEDVVAPKRDPQFLTFINPTHAKGVMLFARLAELLCKQRPEIPIRVVESRGTGDDLLAAGLAGGFDLRQHSNLKVIPNTPSPASIYARTRVLVAPSLWDEPAGRVPVEAMLNGIPPIVSDRGGLPEVCRGGGFVVPVPWHINPLPPTPIPTEIVRPWLDLILRLWDDQPFYEQACQRAREAARHYELATAAKKYAGFFRGLVG